MGAEQLLECLCLGVAELRKACGGMPHGAVMLAELRPGFGVDCRSGVAVIGKPRGEECEPILGVAGARHEIAVTGHEGAGSLSRESPDGLIAAGSLEVGQSGNRQVVVVHIEDVAPRIGEREDPCRTASSRCGRGTEGSLVICPGKPLGNERVEVAPDDRCAVSHPGRDLGGGRRTAHEEGASDALCSRTGEFHTPSVS